MKKICLLFVVAISIVFTVSCVSKQVPVTETYYETQYKTETYTETVNTVVSTKEGEIDLKPTTIWSCELSALGETVSTAYYGFKTSIAQHSKNHVKVTFSGAWNIEDLKNDIEALDLTSVHQIPAPPAQETWSKGDPEILAWLDNLIEITKQHSLPIIETQATYMVFDVTGINEFAIIDMGYKNPSMKSASLPKPISTFQLLWTDEVIGKNTITKENHVPYQVEKQRTVMQTKQVPFWEAIFH